jgi:uncharacterized protein YggE
MRNLMIGVALFLCAAATARADESVVTVAGTASLQKQPTVLRVSLPVSGEGKDLAEAMGKLTKARDDAKAKLVALKPVEGSLVVGESTLADVSQLGMSPQQRQYAAMMNMRRGNQKPAAAPAVTASAMITANFAIPAAAGDDAIVKAYELEKQIKTAVTPAAATGEAKKLTPEEQEMAEEMAAAGQGVPKPGEPTVTYVLAVSDEDAAKLTADALGKAKAQATLLASAAGLKLGAIRKLSSDVNGGASADDMMSGMSGVFRAAMGVAADASREATGTAPGAVTYSVTVSVSYELTK